MQVTDYKFIYFENITPYDGRRTEVWDCRNKTSTDSLGQVRWYGPWRQYVFIPVRDIVLSVGCLSDIQDFIRKLTGKHKQIIQERALNRLSREAIQS